MEKETQILLRISPEDKIEIQKRAKEAGLSVSEYGRKMMLHGSIIKVDLEDKRTLTGLANNLNQLTRHAHLTQVVGQETPEILKKLIDEIRNAYRKR